MFVDFCRDIIIIAIDIGTIPGEFKGINARTAEAVAYGGGEAGMLVDFVGSTIRAVNIGAIPGETKGTTARTAEAVTYSG